MDLTDNELYPIIESLLFTWGDPLDLSDIANILELTKKKTEKLLGDLIDIYSDESKGLRIEKRGSMYQMGTKPEYNDWIVKLNRPTTNKNLSNAALETLSIVAYKQPVIKADIEAIRGVKCDTAIYNLLEKELIEEQGRLERIGRPILYGTTDLFLKVFGLQSLEGLPELNETLNFDDKEEIEKTVDEKLGTKTEDK